jgi:hypothetical protein
MGMEEVAPVAEEMKKMTGKGATSEFSEPSRASQERVP